jgi:hypothetical protein
MLFIQRAARVVQVALNAINSRAATNLAFFVGLRGVALGARFQLGD